MTYREAASAGEQLLVVAFSNHVVGLHVTTGTRVWTVNLTGGFTRIEVVGDRVFALGQELACLHFATGRLVWKAEVPGRCSSGSLLVHGDAVFIGAAGEAACFEAETGRLRWHDPFTGWGLNAVALAVPGRVVQADRDT